MFFSKRGDIMQSTFGKIALGVLFLVLVIAIILILKEKGQSILTYARDLFRFG